jgi:tryptophan synthase beta chain
MIDTAAVRFELPPDAIPGSWYDIVHDLPFELPPDLPPPGPASASALRPQVPLELIRQSLGRRRFVPIPDAVRECYRQWRPTPLVRAPVLERALETPAHIYYKYEGGNGSGSHKLNTALAQAHYYRAAGVGRLTTGTGAGQWGTALAIACRRFGLACKVYMVGRSFRQKPYRKVLMQMQGAEVVASPSADTPSGARLLDGGGEEESSLAFAITEALEDALSREDSRFCIGSGEPYSILHQTLIGQEALEQMEMAGEMPDVVVGSLGAGSNFGGTAFPFLGEQLRGGPRVRCLCVEPSACPKLTRGAYRYDFTDSSGSTPLQKMYTLGESFTTAGIHAGGLRYHASSKLVSALYHHGLVEAVAYPQNAVFASALLFSQTEGIVPAPESAHAVHGAVEEALRCRERGRGGVILFCLSGHGHFDMSAYDDYLAGRLEDVEVSDEEIAASLRRLPVVETAP